MKGLDMVKYQSMLIWILGLVLAVGIGWLLFRFVLPWIAPFLLALLTARLIEPGIQWSMRRFQFKRSFAATVCSLIALGVMLFLVGLAINQLVSSAGTLVQNLPDMAGQMGQIIGELESAVYRFVIAAPVETQAVIQTAIDSFAALLEELPGQLSGLFLSFAAAVATAFPRIVLFVLTYAISVLFMSVSYPQVTAFIQRQIPAKWQARSQALKADLSQSLLKWCRAQVMLIGVTFVLLTVAFLILRIPYAILLAALIALIDALPVLGTGTVLIPWAIIRLLAGDVTMGVGLLLTYCLVSLVHNFMEPRLVGKQLGLHPVATLMAMYLGYRTVGIAGMILFPIGLILLKQFHDQGVVRLWR